MWKHMHDAPAPTLRDPKPSEPDDIAITKTIIEAGKLLDINCLDRAP